MGRSKTLKKIEPSLKDLRRKNYASICKDKSDNEYKDCVTAEIFRKKIKDIGETEHIEIKSSLGILTLTKDVNYFSPKEKISNQELIIKFAEQRILNRGESLVPEEELDQAGKVFDLTVHLAKENKSRGLGDTVEKFTRYTGIKKLIKLIFKETDCGCNERRDTLNRWFPYK